MALHSVWAVTVAPRISESAPIWMWPPLLVRRPTPSALLKSGFPLIFKGLDPSCAQTPVEAGPLALTRPSGELAVEVRCTAFRVISLPASAANTATR